MTRSLISGCSRLDLSPTCEGQCVYRCGSCGLHHAKVEAGGIYHCPNPLCGGSGAAYFRGKLPSTTSDAGRQQVNVAEWVAAAMTVELDPEIAAARERSRLRWTGSAEARWLEPQPAPTGDGASVTDWLLVDLSHPEEPRAPLIARLLRARREQGRERYGTELRAHNGRNATADALQEAVDLLLYVAQRQVENGGPHLGRLSTVYGLVRWLAEELECEDVRRLL